MTVVPRGKFIALDAYIENRRRDITNLTAHMKPLEQQGKKGVDGKKYSTQG